MVRQREAAPTCLVRLDQCHDGIEVADPHRHCGTGSILTVPEEPNLGLLLQSPSKNRSEPRSFPPRYTCFEKAAATHDFDRQALYSVTVQARLSIESSGRLAAVRVSMRGDWLRVTPSLRTILIASSTRLDGAAQLRPCNANYV